MEKKAGRRTSRKPRSRAGTGPQAAERTGAALHETWKATRQAVAAAEQRLEQGVRELIEDPEGARHEIAHALGEARKRCQREGRQAAQEIDAGLRTLGTRLRKERHHLGTTAEDYVGRALAALNIPSRREVTELTRKVDELSRKLDGLRAAARPAPRRRPGPAGGGTGA